MAPINSLTVVDESSTSNMASPGSICVKIAAQRAPRKGCNRKKWQHIAMREVSGDDVHIFLPIVGGLFRQLRLSHKGKAQNIGVGAHAANGI